MSNANIHQTMDYQRVVLEDDYHLTIDFTYQRPVLLVTINTTKN